MTHYFTEDTISELRQCFNLYASDGTVTNDAQLRYIMRSLGYSPTVAETRAYVGKSGQKIDFARFLDIIHAEEKKPDPVIEIAQALQAVDTGNTGFIARSDLVRLLTGYGEHMSADEAKRALKRHGIISEAVSVDRFVHALAKTVVIPKRV